MLSLRLLIPAVEIPPRALLGSPGDCRCSFQSCCQGSPRDCSCSFHHPELLVRNYCSELEAAVPDAAAPAPVVPHQADHFRATLPILQPLPYAFPAPAEGCPSPVLIGLASAEGCVSLSMATTTSTPKREVRTSATQGTTGPLDSTWVRIVSLNSFLAFLMHFQSGLNGTVPAKQGSDSSAGSSMSASATYVCREALVFYRSNGNSSHPRAMESAKKTEVQATYRRSSRWKVFGTDTRCHCRNGPGCSDRAHA
jgi:hypothetical protein